MQTEQMPLALFGVSKFKYTKTDFSKTAYNPSTQVGSYLFSSEGRDTVSDLATTSGFFANNDDEERGADD